MTQLATYCNIMLVETVPMDSFSDYLTVKEAADFLGVSKDTLRRWDRKGKLKAYRHPLNRYRLYKKQDLEKLLGQIKQPKGGGK